MNFTSNRSTNKSAPKAPAAQRAKKALTLKDAERFLNLRLELLGRIETLPHVAIAKVPYITAMGDMISLPGPWSIEVSSVASSALSITASPTTVNETVLADDLDEEHADDDVESLSDFGELPITASRSNSSVGVHSVRGMRSVSNATTNSAMSSFEHPLSPATTATIPASTPTARFVIRNEFGHVRIQPMIEMLEALQERGREVSSTSSSTVPTNPDVIRIGGHIVLPPADFASCIAAGLGEQHPFAGRYHPIAGNTIPETTLLFYGPRSEEELEAIWAMVRKSYEWVFSSCN